MFILCGCVGFTRRAASDFASLPRILVNLARFKLLLFYLFFFVSICDAASDARSFIDRFWVTIENADDGGGLRTNRAQISLRRDICSETISQVVICGIIASPTHKCMGVCMRYASLCVWHTVVPGVSA